MPADTGVLAKFGLGDAGSVATKLIDVDENESVTAVNEQADANAIKGSRTRRAHRVRRGAIRVGGSFSWTPTVPEWQFILPKICGGTAFDGSAGSTLTDALPSFSVQKQLRSGAVWRYDGLMVNSATIRVMPSAPVKLTIDCIGLTRISETAFPAIQLDESDQFFMGHEVTAFTIGGTSYATAGMEATITINNAVRARYPMGSREATLVYPTDRVVGVAVVLPAGEVTWTRSGGALTGPYVDADAATTLTLVAGNDTMAFTFGAVRYTHSDPVISDRGEILHRLNGTAYRAAGSVNEEMLIDLDRT